MPISDYCLADQCMAPVDLRDGQYCTKHSMKIKVKPEPEPREIFQQKKIERELRGEDLQSALVSRRGIKTTKDFAQFMAGLMSDLVEGCIEPQVAVAACVAGEKLLKVVDMQIKYGKQDKSGKSVPLLLTGNGEESL